MSLDPRLEVHRPLARLRQQFGPFLEQWTLYHDRLEIRTTGPLRERFTPLELERIDSVSQVQEVPWPLVGLAAGSLVIFLVSLALAAYGRLDVGPLFAAATVAGFLVYALGAWRVSWVEIETLGGGVFWMRGGRPSAAEVRQFLGRLRQARTEALKGTDVPEAPPYEELGGWEDPEHAGRDEGPIDPRWIN